MKRLVVAFLVSLSTLAGAPLFQTSFENPPYIVGELPGQDGWLQDIGPDGIFNVQDRIVYSGAQAISFSAQEGVPTFTRVGRFVNFDTSAGVAQVTLQMRAYFASNEVLSHWRPFAAFDGNSFIGSFDVLQSGEVASPTELSGVFLARDAWYLIGAIFDFATSTYSLQVEGDTVLSGLPFDNGGGNPIFSSFTIEVVTAGTDTAYFDDLEVSAVPEPSSIALSLAGLALVAVSRLRRR